MSCDELHGELVKVWWRSIRLDHSYGCLPGSPMQTVPSTWRPFYIHVVEALYPNSCFVEVCHNNNSSYEEPKV